MNWLDRAALTQALAMCRAESDARAWQINSMLEDRPWAEVARFAASCCQSRSLHLEPWSLPPCSVSEDDDGDIDADAVAAAQDARRWRLSLSSRSADGA